MAPFERLLVSVFLAAILLSGCGGNPSAPSPIATVSPTDAGSSASELRALSESACGGEESAGNPFPCCDNGGNCTWYMWKKAKDEWGVELHRFGVLGNAAEWAAQARAGGIPSSTQPAVGTIAVNTTSLPNGCKNRSTGQTVPCGHVAWVTATYWVTDPFTFKQERFVEIEQMKCCSTCAPGVTTDRVRASDFDGGFLYSPNGACHASSGGNGLGLRACAGPSLPPDIMTAEVLPALVVGSPYQSRFEASGGMPPYSWRSANGNGLPPGLALSASGVLSGVGTTAGTFAFRVQVVDSANAAREKAFTLIATQALVPTLSITTQNPLPNAAIGNAFRVVLEASGGTQPYEWTVASGQVPAGLSLEPNGVISGSPTTPGGSTFRVRLRDVNGRTAEREFALTVTGTQQAAGPLVLQTTGLPPGSVDIDYAASLQASGGVSPYRWIVSGLPSGLSVSSSSGLISGRATQSGSFSLHVIVSDSGGGSTSRAVSLAINASTAPPPLRITSSSTLPRATIDQAYSFRFTATGGSGGHQWAFVSSPDPNLQLAADGTLSGVPSRPNDCSGVWSTVPTQFQVRVTDSSGRSETSQFCLSSLYPQQQVSGVTPSTIAVDGVTHTLTVNGTNFRTDAILSVNGARVASTYVGATALTFTISPGTEHAFRDTGGLNLNPGTFSLTLAQGFSEAIVVQNAFSIMDPQPSISSATAVLNNSTQACTAGNTCQLVITGGGFMPATNYEIRPLFVTVRRVSPLM